MADDRLQDHRVPPAAGTVGMWLFLASLTMLFAASLLGYVIIRLKGGPAARTGALHLPRVLWLSTALVIGASVSLHRALSEVRRERQQSFRRWLTISLVLGIGFVIIQIPAMASLLVQHRELRKAGVGIYGLVFVLVLVHALHVLGGIIALVLVQVRARQDAYDHEHYQPVRQATLYWHFLDIVWLTMFGVFLLVG
jgi:heme/copper-type cytochrome/quinol oxidase subunit 3